MNNQKTIRILSIISLILPSIYIILSMINVYDTELSTSIFHDTYEKWKNTIYFTPLHPDQRNDFIASVMAVLPFISVCIISVFSKKLKGSKKLIAAVLSFLLFMFFNYIEMNSVYQSTCSDDSMMIGLVSELQSIIMLLIIISFLLLCCTAAVEMYAEKARS